MQAFSAAMAPERPGKQPAWIPFRGATRYAAPDDGLPAVAYPHAPVGINSLDAVRSVFWQAYRHLFPPHSLAAQTPNGSIVISWSIMDEPDARYPYAAPVVLRFDDALIEAMQRCDAQKRARLAEKHETTLREGLRGYDPFARFPNARVVVIG
ncbi:MAG: hypothetical protein EOO24_62475 [Comamonadaceae bacterium]|nr:MAG: hypothetical protein EOO24_62475 [Comamonadaceae bacterium]